MIYSTVKQGEALAVSLEIGRPGLDMTQRETAFLLASWEIMQVNQGHSQR